MLPTDRSEAPFDPSRLFSALLDSTRLVVYLKDSNGRYLYINKRYENLAGVPASVIMGKTDFDLFAPEVAELFRSQDAQVIAKGEPIEFEETIPLPAGTLSFITEKFPVLGADGKVWAVGGFCTETTLQNRRAEESFAVERERSKVTINSIRDGIISTDVDGIVLMLNPAAEKLLGRKNSEAAGRPLDEVLRTSGLAKNFQASRFVRAAAGSEAAKGAHERVDFKSADGTIRRGLISAASVSDRNGRPIGLVFCLRDMTELEATNAALDQALHEKQTIMKTIPDVFYRLDAEMNTVDWNKAVEDVTGYTPQELRGKNALEFFRQDKDVAADGIREAIAKGHAFREARYLTKAGEEVPYFWSAAALRNDDGTLRGVVGVGRDITAQKRVEFNTLTTQKLDSLGVLAGGIAHDFNNILTAILGNLSLLQDRAKKGSEASELIQEAEDACGTATSLSRQLLTFSEGGHPVLKVMDLGLLVRKLADFAARGTNSHCVLDLGDAPLPVNADKDQIAQVFQNLIINATQAMPAGGEITVRASVVGLGEKELPPMAAGRYVRVTVSDRGTGIRAEVLSKIFDPYFSTKSAGRGLGLSVCYSIVAKHGGHIGVASEMGKGTTFTLHLPAANTPDILPESERPAVTAGHGRVLIMDDEPTITKLLTRMLERLGYQGSPVDNGLAALEAYAAAKKEGRPYDAVILDLNIPGSMGGEEVMQKLRALDSGVKGIVSSGYSTNPAMSEYAAHGFSGALSKPYALEKVSDILRRVIGPKSD